MLHGKLLFISKYFNITRKPAFAHFSEQEKQTFHVIYYLYKMKQYHWLLYAAKNFDWPRIIMPLSNLTLASLLVEWKLTVKAKLNCELYKENVGKLKSVFVIRAALWALCEPKSLDDASKIAGVEKIPSGCGCGQPSYLEPAIWFELWMKGAFATLEIFVFCSL